MSTVYCYRHPSNVSSAICEKCNKPICDLDLRKFDANLEKTFKTLCPKCFESLHIKGDKKLAIAFSIVVILSLLTTVPLFLL